MQQRVAEREKRLGVKPAAVRAGRDKGDSSDK
jgi:hypothetical protein